MNWSDVGEFTKAVAPVFTAGAACTGAWIGWRGLEKWRDETIGKRKAELAEQALMAFYEARDALAWVRAPVGFGGEGESRTPSDGETKTQQKKRNTYFIPIERLTHEKELFARLQSLRYAFAAQFGEAASEPFKAITSVQNEIRTSASVLIGIVYDDDNDRAFAKSAEPLLNTIGWGAVARPDDVDRKIEKAVKDIEVVCRPVLAAAPTK